MKLRVETKPQVGKSVIKIGKHVGRSGMLPALYMGHEGHELHGAIKIVWKIGQVLDSNSCGRN